MKLNAKQLAEFHQAQTLCYKKLGPTGMARIMEDGTKEVGTLILPEIHEKISDAYTIAHGFKLMSAGGTWAQVFEKVGWYV